MNDEKVGSNAAWGSSARRAALALILAIAISALLLTQVVSFVRVSGNSMAPTLNDGDLVLADVRSGAVRSAGVGDVVVFRIDSDSRPIAIKRVVATENGALRVAGDNVDASRDSRHYGAVPRESVTGRVLLRIFPSPSRIAASQGEARR